MLLVGTAGELPLLGKYKGYLHEYKDQHGVMEGPRRVAPGAAHGDPEQVTLELLARMQTGRSRPMTMEVPIDVLAESATVAPADAPPSRPHRPRRRRHPAHRRAPAPRPLPPPLRRGGRLAHAGASDLLLELAETLGAPVLTSISGKGAIPDSSIWSAGCTWRTSSGPTDGYLEVWRQADAGLVVGSRPHRDVHQGLAPAPAPAPGPPGY